MAYDEKRESKVKHPLFAERCRKLQRELPALSGAVVRSRLMTIGVMYEDMDWAIRVLRWDEEKKGRDALGSLALAIFADKRLERVHAAAARFLTAFDVPAGRSAMLERWIKDPESVRALDAYVAWVRLDRPDPELAPALCEALILQFAKRNENVEELNQLDKTLASIGTDSPASLVRPLLRYGPAAMIEALAKRLVADAESESTIHAILEDDGLRACHDPASERLAAMSEEAARWVLAHHERANHVALRRAVRWIAPDQLYDLVAPRLAANEHHASRLWFAVLETRGAARDRRWIDLADLSERALLHGGAMLIAIGRDYPSPFKDEAVAKLARAMETTHVDDIRRSFHLTSLGKTGNPTAVAPLLRELARPGLGFGTSSVITALGDCAGVDVIPTLEQWRTRDASLTSYCTTAIDKILDRAARLDACDDPDPVLADLARRARDGDPDAALVLDDALRDRGRLPP